MTTGKRIQQARKRAGLSQKQLGERLGLSASMIGQWENDLRNPKAETLLRIAKALRVGIGVLAPEDIVTAYNAGYEAAISTKRSRAAKDEREAQDAEDDTIALLLYFDDLNEQEQKQAILCLRALAGWPGIDAQKVQPIEELLISFLRLSPIGQKEAVKRVEELTEIPRYRADTTQPPDGSEDK